MHSLPVKMNFTHNNNMDSFISIPIICYQLVPFQTVQCRKRSLQNSFRKTYLFEIPRQGNTLFSFKKKGRTKKE